MLVTQSKSGDSAFLAPYLALFCSFATMITEKEEMVKETLPVKGTVAGNEEIRIQMDNEKQQLFAANLFAAKLFAFDLDGTLTQHKTPLSAENRAVLEKLSKKAGLCMVGAGMCRRIFEQMGQFPIDIIGNYGMQVAVYNKEKRDLELVEDIRKPVDRKSVEERVNRLRQKYGYTEYEGENVEYHASGCITFPLLGTKAKQESKLSFDPDRTKRRAIYEEVRDTFPEYTVFVGGSSSFDMAPRPYDKYYALDRYCRERGYAHDRVFFVGDDYGTGGNDESVYHSDFHFIQVDDYRKLPQIMEPFL